jgi:hypothetical protein
MFTKNNTHPKKLSPLSVAQQEEEEKAFQCASLCRIYLFLVCKFVFAGWML